MKTSINLNLVLKKKWYEMIASGVKTEEYREIKTYWTKRLDCSVFLNPLNIDKLANVCEGCPFAACREILFVTFHLGYTNTTMQFQLLSIKIGRGKPEWGAPTDKDVFILKLGKRID